MRDFVQSIYLSMKNTPENWEVVRYPSSYTDSCFCASHSKCKVKITVVAWLSMHNSLVLDGKDIKLSRKELRCLQRIVKRTYRDKKHKLAIADRKKQAEKIEAFNKCLDI
jgi:hypothetical protein